MKYIPYNLGEDKMAKTDFAEKVMDVVEPILQTRFRDVADEWIPIVLQDGELAVQAMKDEIRKHLSSDDVRATIRDMVRDELKALHEQLTNHAVDTFISKTKIDHYAVKIGEAQRTQQERRQHYTERTIIDIGESSILQDICERYNGQLITSRQAMYNLQIAVPNLNNGKNLYLTTGTVILYLPRLASDVHVLIRANSGIRTGANAKEAKNPLSIQFMTPRILQNGEEHFVKRTFTQNKVFANYDVKDNEISPIQILIVKIRDMIKRCADTGQTFDAISSRQRRVKK